MRPNNHQMPHILWAAFALPAILLGAILTISCGGGSDTLAGGGIGGTGVTIGTVTQYGSIFVNGIEHNTHDAEVFVDGLPMGSGDAAVLDLVSLGRQAVIQGTQTSTTTAKADTIEIFLRVQGPLMDITQIDDTQWSLNIMGQQVYSDAQTRWPAGLPETVAVDCLMAADGVVDQNGAIRATFIAIVSEPNAPARVMGEIQDLNPDQQTFNINDLTVAYDNAEGDTANLSQGMTVSVGGTFDGNRLIADTLTDFRGDAFLWAEHFSLEGVVSEVIDANRLNIGSYGVRINQATTIEGLQPEDLSVGIKIRVSGPLADGTIEAEAIVYDAKVKMESNVSGVDLSASTITLEGLAGPIIQFGPLTAVHGDKDSLEALLVGDHVRLQGFYNEGLDIFEVDKCSVSPTTVSWDRVVVQGPLSGIADPVVLIAGIAVDTSPISEEQFFDGDETSVSRDDFFSLLEDASDNGISLRAAGHTQNGTAVFEQVSIDPAE